MWDETAGGIQTAAFFSRRWHRGWVDVSFCIVLAALPTVVGEREYRVATLTVSEHTARSTIALHQRRHCELCRFVSRSI